MNVIGPLSPLMILLALAALWAFRMRRRARFLRAAFEHDPIGTRDAMCSALLGLRGDIARQRATRLRDDFQACYPDLYERYRQRALI